MADMRQTPALERFFDARFGLFIHWGLYSLLAGEWQGQRMDDIGEWIMSYHKIPIRDYEQLAARFNPTAFDAEAIVRMAKRAGMRYLVITSKHHEGFALFHSKADRYNVVEATPFGRDIIAELATACRKHDLKLGLYYSQALDWHERDAGGWDDPAYLPERRPWANIWDFPDPAGKNFEAYFSRKVLPQVREILTQYGDIFLIWFDTPRTISTEQSRRLYDLVKSIQPDCLVNSRIGNGLGDYSSLGDNQLPTIPLTVATESPVTLNDTWGYKSYDHNWKSSHDIIGKLVRLAAKNTNFLLNIGPRGDGSIPEETVRILEETGAWSQRNTQAIFGTRGNPCSYDFAWGSLTARTNQLFCFIDDNQKQQLTINGLRTRVLQVMNLDANLPATYRQDTIQDGTALTIDLTPTESVQPAYRIDLAGVPEFAAMPMSQDQGQLLLFPHLAAAKRQDVPFVLPRQGLGDRYKKVTTEALSSAGSLVGWTDPTLTLTWDALLLQDGTYQAAIQLPVHYLQEPSPVPHQFRLTVTSAAESLNTSWTSVTENGGSAADSLLTLQAGQYRLTLQAIVLAPDRPLSFQSVSLYRV